LRRRGPNTALPEPHALRSVSASVTALGPDDLRELMRAVTETTQRLESTHLALHNEVGRLQRELAEANAALRRSEALAALGEMAAGIAHEIRNPLGSIQLYVQMLAEDLADRPAQAEVCEKIDRAVVGLDAVVRDVLSFARDMTIRPEPVTSDELLDRAIASCASLLSDGIELMREAGVAQRLQADPSLVTQALGNIIRNAVEAMVESEAPRRLLRVGASRRRVRCPNGRQEARIILSVQDSGPGIAPEVIDRIFNPFFTTRKIGTGLGLAIVHRIVDAHGGHINIEPVSDGPGTRMELCMPAKPTLSVPNSKSQEHAGSVEATNTEHGA